MIVHMFSGVDPEAGEAGVARKNDEETIVLLQSIHGQVAAINVDQGGVDHGCSFADGQILGLDGGKGECQNGSQGEEERFHVQLVLEGLHQMTIKASP